MTAEVEEHQWASDEIVKQMIVADDDELLRLTGEWCEAVTANWFPKVLVQRLYRLASTLRSSGLGEGWRPIETWTEEDGNCLIVSSEVGIVTEGLKDGRGWYVMTGRNGSRTETPTHWMPLPEAPLPASPKALKTGGE